MLGNKTKRIFGLFLLIMMISSLMITVFAAGVTINQSTAKKVGYSDGSITAENIMGQLSGDKNQSSWSHGNITFTKSTGILSVNTQGEEYQLLQVSSSGNSKAIYIEPKAFKNAKNTDVITAMEKFTEAMTDCGGNPDTVQQIMSDIQDVDSSVSSVMLPLIINSSKGNMYKAYLIAKPFLDVLSVVLGVGAVILILLLLFSTVMDLAYIGLPVWREAQAGKDGGKKHPFGVSYEALRTVDDVEKGIGGGDGEYRNSYLLYFRRRALTYIILAICIMYLICGGLSGVIAFVLNLVSGITGV